MWIAEQIGHSLILIVFCMVSYNAMKNRKRDPWMWFFIGCALYASAFLKVLIIDFLFFRNINGSIILRYVIDAVIAAAFALIIKNTMDSLAGRITCVRGDFLNWHHFLQENEILVIGSAPGQAGLELHTPGVSPKQCMIRYDKKRNLYMVQSDYPQGLSLEKYLRDEEGWRIIPPGSRFAMGVNWTQMFRVE